MLLVILLTVFSFMPIATISTNHENLEEYYEGSLTGEIEEEVSTELGLGVGSLFSTILNLGDIISVIEVQMAEAALDSFWEDHAEDLKDYSGDAYLSFYETLEERYEQKAIDLALLIEEYELEYGEDLEDLTDKLEDDADFRDQVALFYAIADMFPAENFENLGDDVAPEQPIIQAMLFIGGLLTLLITAIVVSIIFVVKTIIRLVKFIIGMTKCDFRQTDRITTGLPTKSYIVTLLGSFFMLAYLFGSTIQIGSGAIGVLVSILIIGALRIADEVIYEENNVISYVNLGVKKGLTLISIILVLVLSFNFANAGIFQKSMNNYDEYHDTRVMVLAEKRMIAQYGAKFEKEGVDFEDAYKDNKGDFDGFEAYCMEALTEYYEELYYDEYYEQYEDSYYANDYFNYQPFQSTEYYDRYMYNVESDANDAYRDVIAYAESNLEFGARILYTYSPIVLFFFATGLLSMLIDRFCFTKGAKKRKEKKNISAIVYAVIILVLAIIPTTYGVKSEKKMEASFEKGEYVVMYDEYKNKDSEAYEYYIELKETVKEAKEEYKDVYDELDEDEQIMADKYLAMLEAELARVETTEEDDLSTSMTSAIVILVLEVGYLVAAIVLGSMAAKAPVAKKVEEEEEAPAEEAAPTQEAPAEEIAEEALAEETVTEEAPAEETAPEAAPAE